MRKFLSGLRAKSSTNLVSELRKDRKINVTSRVLFRKHLISANLLEKRGQRKPLLSEPTHKKLIEKNKFDWC